MHYIFTYDDGVHIPSFTDIKAVFCNSLGGVSEGVYSSLNLGFDRGDSEENVKKNFEIVCTRLGVSSDSLVFNKQVHASTVTRIDSTAQCMGLDRTKTPAQADVFVTNVKGVTLTCFYADCTPILFYDPDKKVIATAHAGWRGTISGSQKAAVAAMEQYGCDPHNILAAIGPCISAENYEVGTEVASNFTSDAISMVDGVEHVDLRRANILALKEVGICDEHISVCPDCTFADDRYFSHRRMGDRRGSGCAFISL